MDGKQFRQARIDAGYKSQQSVADDIGRNVRTITRWENDQVPVPEYAVKFIVRERDRYQKRARRPIVI